MKAILLEGYGDVSQLHYGDAPEPQPGPGEVLVKVLGTSVNPIDYKIRRGDMKERMPLEFPYILGRDVAGEVVGGGSERLKTGQRVMGLVNQAYAEFVVAKVEELALIPEGLDAETAAALPLVVLTGAQLIELGVQPAGGETILITGALGSVARTAIHVAQKHGVKVIAGVKRSQLEEAQKLGAEQVVALDDDSAISGLPQLDAIADTVGHEVIGKVLPHLKPGGRLATVLGKPEAAEGRDLKLAEVWAKPDAARLQQLATEVLNGEFTIPIAQRLALARAAEAQAAAEEGSAGGKIVLVP